MGKQYGKDMKKQSRLWEVDSARGIAIIMMLISNLLFDLYLFKGFIEFYSGFWLYFARVTAALFILIAGLSLTLSYSRVSNKSRGFKIRKYVKRGLWIFAIGILITIATYLAIGSNFVLFGILHLIGIGIILAYPFLRYRVLNLVLGLIIILIGFLLQNITFNFPWLVWLGLQYPGFNSVDYVPVFPWFGLILIGVFLGNLLFPEGNRRYKTGINHLLTRILSRMGRNSLIIYLVHQPVFVGLILLF